MFKPPVFFFIYIKLPFWHFPWHLQKIRHFTLFLLHLQFLHLVEQQQIFDIISTVVILSSGCHFESNLPFFIFHPHSNGSCDATLFSPSFHDQPLGKEARLICSFKPFLEESIDRKFEFGVALTGPYSENLWGHGFLKW